jgi:Short C-terminal domain
MRPLSASGRAVVQDIAQRHGFSPEATSCMLDAVINGAGAMAQFDHPEFGGSGQWMRGGMTMVSDMFNHRLKGQVDALCMELAKLVAAQPDLMEEDRAGSFQSQSQSGGGRFGPQQSGGRGSAADRQQQAGAGVGMASLFVPPPPGMSGDWWPSGLGHPSSVGTQNGVRYAYFATARRLVIEVHGKLSVYDTLDHRIGGFSQQQSVGGSLSFQSQHGLIDVASLPLVEHGDMEGAEAEAQPQPQPQTQPRRQSAAPREPGSQAQPHAYPQPAPAAGAQAGSQPDVFSAIEKLAGLKSRGILTDEEFAAKKAELLKRI